MSPYPTNDYRRRDGGFSLIELLVVVIVIGVLAAIAVPVFLEQRTKAHTAAVKGDLKAGAQAMETEYVDNRAYPGSLPPTVRTSSGVTVTVSGGLSENDALFRDFVAACNAFPNWSCLYPFTAIPGSMRRTVSVSPYSNNWYGAGAAVTEVANEIGWAGTVPRVPSTEVNLNAGPPTDSYCLVGYHDSKPSSTWHWDSLRGGLAQGNCP